MIALPRASLQPDCGEQRQNIPAAQLPQQRRQTAPQEAQISQVSVRKRPEISPGFWRNIQSLEISGLLRGPSLARGRNLPGFGPGSRRPPGIPRLAVRRGCRRGAIPGRRPGGQRLSAGCRSSLPLSKQGAWIREERPGFPALAWSRGRAFGGSAPILSPTACVTVNLSALKLFRVPYPSSRARASRGSSPIPLLALSAGAPPLDSKPQAMRLPPAPGGCRSCPPGALLTGMCGTRGQKLSERRRARLDHTMASTPQSESEPGRASGLSRRPATRPRRDRRARAGHNAGGAVPAPALSSGHGTLGPPDLEERARPRGAVRRRRTRAQCILPRAGPQRLPLANPSLPPISEWARSAWAPPMRARVLWSCGSMPRAEALAGVARRRNCERGLGTGSGDGLHEAATVEGAQRDGEPVGLAGKQV